jgi:hypothetical protein
MNDTFSKFLKLLRISIAHDVKYFFYKIKGFSRVKIQEKGFEVHTFVYNLNGIRPIWLTQMVDDIKKGFFGKDTWVSVDDRVQDFMIVCLIDNDFNRKILFHNNPCWLLLLNTAKGRGDHPIVISVN